MNNQFEIEDSTMLVNILHPFKIGNDLTGKMLAQITYNPDASKPSETMDIDFADTIDTTYMGKELNYGSFKDLKETLLNYGINVNEELKKQFEELFTTENVKKLLKIK